MCGIVGEIGPYACDEHQLLRMMGMLTHRGPDEAGLLLSEGISLGHLRLSIIDLRSGQQPMSSHDGRYWVVFNGEIFNHLELRRELEALGHTFLTQSDTEVLINAYREWGPECLDRLNGQWAFTLWDRSERSFFLARDRWGVRPLFYTHLSDSQTLVFASEIKAILADDRVSRQWDPQSLEDILICWVSESDRTPLKSVRQLPPGSYMMIKNGDIRICQWWELNYSPDDIQWNRSMGSWCEEVRATLADACRIRLRADVPVGAYLSGGLDSSIVSLTARNCHQGQLQTFSISFADKVFDESAYQQIMAEHLGTAHRALQITRESIAKGFEQAVWHAETPICRTAPVPMMYLSGLVRNSGFKVVLTGEGADELFGGYDQFKEDKIRRFWSRYPRSSWRKRLLERLDFKIPNTSARSRAFWYAFYQKGLDKTERAAYSHHIRWLNGISLLPLLKENPALTSLSGTNPADSYALSSVASKDWIERIESTAPPDFERWLPLSKAQYWETRQLLSGYLLSSQGDRMSMANSVEGRYPFLDLNLYHVARRMPPSLKLQALMEKYILKKAFSQDLPTEMIRRRKQPYRAPDALALCHGILNDPLMDNLSPESVRRRELFNPGAVEKLIARLKRSPEPSARDNMALVFVYSSHIFHDCFVRGPMTPHSLPPLKTRVHLAQTPVGSLG